MTTLTWRVAPIMLLTIRQFVGGKAVRVVIGLTAIPVIFALIYLINPSVSDPTEYLVKVVFRGAYAPTILPITVLILATGAIGNEIEDRTLPYLTLKPVSRLRIVIEKLLGSIVVALPIILIGLAITYFLVMRGAWSDNLRLLWGMWGAASAGTVAYAAIFLLVSLLITRALLAGIIYSLVWESLLGRYLPGIRYISVRHYTESVFIDILNNPLYKLKNSFGLSAAVITVLAAAAVAILISTWRLRRMNLE